MEACGPQGTGIIECCRQLQPNSLNSTLIKSLVNLVDIPLVTERTPPDRWWLRCPSPSGRRGGDFAGWTLTGSPTRCSPPRWARGWWWWPPGPGWVWRADRSRDGQRADRGRQTRTAPGPRRGQAQALRERPQAFPIGRQVDTPQPTLTEGAAGPGPRSTPPGVGTAGPPPPPQSTARTGLSAGILYCTIVGWGFDGPSPHAPTGSVGHRRSTS